MQSLVSSAMKADLASAKAESSRLDAKLRGQNDKTGPGGWTWSDAQAPYTAKPSVRIEPADNVRRRSVAWAGMSAEIVRVTRLQKVEMSFAAPAHLLIAYEHGLRQTGETRVSDATSALRNLKGKLTFVPAGHEFCEWQTPVLLPQFTCLYIEPSGQFEMPGAGCASGSLTPRLLFEDPVLWETVSKLKRLIESAHVVNQQYIAAVGTVICHELTHAMSGRTAPERRARGGLASWQLRVVTDYIEAHLNEAIPLPTLAGLIRLSPHHFCRAFKQSLGQSPGRYHGRRRTERAKLLLAEPNITVAEVASRVGFGETSVFTAAFRRGTGLTPTAFRRSLS
jgi:AraC family transcriptional regulator